MCSKEALVEVQLLFCGVVINAVTRNSNDIVPVYKLPCYPFVEKGQGKMSALLNKEPSALRNPYIGITPGTIDHEEKE